MMPGMLAGILARAIGVEVHPALVSVAADTLISVAQEVAARYRR